MRKVFRFGLRLPADAFILVTVLETILALIYVLLDGTEFFTAGLHLSTASQNLLVPPMVKWLVSLLKFGSVAVLWAHLFRSVSRRALQLWIAVGLVHDLLCPAWVVVQDVLNKQVPDSSYPPLYRIVLLLSFRFYVYYFVYKFSKEMPPPEEGDSPWAPKTSSSSRPFLWCSSSSSSSSSFSYSNPSLEDDEGQPVPAGAGEEEAPKEPTPTPPPSPVKKSVQFDPQPPVTIEAAYPDDGSTSKGGSSTSTSTGSSSLDAALPQEPVALELAHLLRTWRHDLDSMARLVRLLLIIEIVWNAYVLLIHEIRFGMAPQARKPRQGDETKETAAHEGIFSINETVTLEMIWIRIGFIAIAMAGLVMLRIRGARAHAQLVTVALALGYLVLVGVNLAHVVKVQNWPALLQGHGQGISINLTLTVLFIGANALLKSCVGYVLLRFGIARASCTCNGGGRRQRYVIDNQIEIGGVGSRGGGWVTRKRGDNPVELVFVINREPDHEREGGAGPGAGAGAIQRLEEVAVAEAARIKQFTEL